MNAKRGLTLALVAAGAFAGGFFCGNRFDRAGSAGDNADAAVEELADESADDSEPAPEAADEPAEEPFEEAVDRAAFEREQSAAPAPTVEEVRDEDGLTADERQEKLRRERPEEYEAALRRRQERHERRQREQLRRQNFLETVDPALLSEDERILHQAFTAALAARTELRAAVRAATERGEPVAETDRDALRDAERAVRKQAEAERTLLLRAAARSLGLEGEAVEGFQQTVEDICSATGRR